MAQGLKWLKDKVFGWSGAWQRHMFLHIAVALGAVVSSVFLYSSLHYVRSPSSPEIDRPPSESRNSPPQAYRTVPLGKWDQPYQSLPEPDRYKPPPNVIGSSPARTGSLSPLDAALEKMVKGNIVFNNPEKMHLGDTGEVEAVLAVNMRVDDLMKELTAAGKREQASLLVSDHMQATLSGGGAFDVAPTGPQSQWISQQRPTTWHWLVTPRLVGTQYLILTMDAIITLRGEKGTRNITTLERKIEVEVAQSGVHWWSWERVKQILEGLAAFVMVSGAIAGAIDKRHEILSWFRKHFQRKPKQPPVPPNIDIPDEDRD